VFRSLEPREVYSLVEETRILRDEMGLAAPRVKAGRRGRVCKVQRLKSDGSIAASSSSVILKVAHVDQLLVQACRSFDSKQRGERSAASAGGWRGRIVPYVENVNPYVEFFTVAEDAEPLGK
jgi:hypothetical protein